MRYVRVLLGMRLHALLVAHAIGESCGVVIHLVKIGVLLRVLDVAP